MLFLWRARERFTKEPQRANFSLALFVVLFVKCEGAIHLYCSFCEERASDFQKRGANFSLAVFKIRQKFFTANSGIFLEKGYSLHSAIALLKSYPFFHSLLALFVKSTGASRSFCSFSKERGSKLFPVALFVKSEGAICSLLLFFLKSEGASCSLLLFVWRAIQLFAICSERKRAKERMHSFGKK